MTTSTLRVPGMSCEVCSARVRGALTDLPGVERVDVDLASKRVTIRHAGRLGEAELAAAVEGRGYEVARRPAP